MAPVAGPAWATATPLEVQTPEQPAARAYPPPVDPAKLASATQT